MAQIGLFRGWFVMFEGKQCSTCVVLQTEASYSAIRAQVGERTIDNSGPANQNNSPAVVPTPTTTAPRGRYTLFFPDWRCDQLAPGNIVLARNNQSIHPTIGANKHYNTVLVVLPGGTQKYKNQTRQTEFTIIKACHKSIRLGRTCIIQAQVYWY